MDYRLQITHIHGLVGINKYDSVLSVAQPKADLNIDTTTPDLNIHNDFPRVIIDQSRCFSEAGLKSILELTDEYAQRGRAAALEAIASKARNGDRMAAIQNKGDAIVQIATEKALPPPADSLMVLMPVSRPRIEVTGGISLNPEPGRVNINFSPNAPEISFSPHSIRYDFVQAPFFRFEFVGNNVDVNA